MYCSLTCFIQQIFCCVPWMEQASGQNRTFQLNFIKMVATCIVCVTANASVYCQNDKAMLCDACDKTIHSANVLSSRHVRVPVCGLCHRSPSVWWCEADAAHLCSVCDAEVHEGNPLPHTRVPVTPCCGGVSVGRGLKEGLSQIHAPYNLSFLLACLFVCVLGLGDPVCCVTHSLTAAVCVLCVCVLIGAVCVCSRETRTPMEQTRASLSFSAHAGPCPTHPSSSSRPFFSSTSSSSASSPSSSCSAQPHCPTRAVRRRDLCLQGRLLSPAGQHEQHAGAEWHRGQRLRGRGGA